MNKHTDRDWLLVGATPTAAPADLNSPIEPEPDPIEIDPRSCDRCGLTIDLHHRVDEGEGPEFFCDECEVDIRRAATIARLRMELKDLRDRESARAELAAMGVDARQPPEVPAAENIDGMERGNGSSSETKAESKNPAIHATPFVYKDPSKIPLRQHLYGKVLIRKFVSIIIGQTGVGKSTLSVAETLSQVSAKALLGVHVPEPLRVWLWNLEDPQEETDRKIAAAMLHYGLTANDIGDRLFTDSGRDQPLVTAEMTRNGATILRPVIDSLVDEMKRRKIDIIKIDPFVSSHTVPENDNGAMDMIVKEWGRVGDRTNAAVELSHHPRKSNGTEVTAEDARGASSTISAARVKRPINRMTPAEANQAGVKNHGLYFRTVPDTSLAPPVDKSDWFKLVSVDLGNGPPNGPGDSVGVVTKWEWPDHLAGMTAADFDKVAVVIRGDKWRQHPKAKKWVGIAVARALDLSVVGDHAKITAMLKLWTDAGSLIDVDGLDEKRNTRKFIEVNDGDQS
jgi:AAA domain